MRFRPASMAPLAICLALACGMTACGTDTSAPTRPASSADAAAPADPGDDTAKLEQALAQFPATPPRTVVAASVPLAEVLTLLDIPVAGVPSTTTQQLPAALDGVPRIGSTMAPDVEKIVDLAPDLVLAAGSSRSAIEAGLAPTGASAVFLDTDSFGDLEFAVRVLGTAFDRKPQADKLLGAMHGHESALAEAGAGSPAPKVLMLIGAADSFMVMNGDTFLGSLIDLSGADNVADSALRATETYSAVNLENIIAAAPDVLLVLRSGDVAEGQAAFDAAVAKNPAWKSLPAYAAGRIHVLDYATFGYTSLGRLDSAVPALTCLLHP
ncbi:ABC transporter substrate-binding protein [Speluncibacter jeojiensis]|uniref:ABC transporter substrate-binding protein n=1 Tax=Speluncibacter jeojiensis TaxID=2710754 RepID=A0A9X4LXH4_9ACTN|nr:ABC transporter substrate-binding protein [Corynebacteriales bacterium D3-21]